jgi:hypothetical protein
MYKNGIARLSKIDLGDQRLQTRLFRELSKIGIEELCAPRAAARRRIKQ